jgi:predicted RNA binding protein YcfA (HicA-like mRNA interferase family)
MNPLLYRTVKRRLEELGFVEVGQKGSHVKFGKMTPEGFRTAIVPRHREISVGTLRSILRQAGIKPDDFFYPVDDLIHQKRKGKSK